MATEVLARLDEIHTMIWDIREDADFDAISTKIAHLRAQSSIMRALERAAKNIDRSQQLNAQARVSRFIDFVYTPNEGSQRARQAEHFRNLSCEALILIGISYRPSDISKLSRTDAAYLLRFVPLFLQHRHLPPRWMFRTELRHAIADLVDTEFTANFRKSWSPVSRCQIS